MVSIGGRLVGWFRLRVSQVVAVRCLWGWRIYLQGGLLTWLPGWCRQIDSSPHGLLKRALGVISQYGGWLLSELMSEDYSVMKQKLLMTFMMYLQKSHIVASTYLIGYTGHL